MLGSVNLCDILKIFFDVRLLRKVLSIKSLILSEILSPNMPMGIKNIYSCPNVDIPLIGVKLFDHQWPCKNCGTIFLEFSYWKTDFVMAQVLWIEPRIF